MTTYEARTTEINNLNDIEDSDINNTRKAGLDVLYFNRVPKAGSSLFKNLLFLLSKHNNFVAMDDPPLSIAKYRLNEKQQIMMTELISNLPSPASYAVHSAYTNFTKFNVASPIYFNMVRHPVDRIISWFYYIRAPWYIEMQKKNQPDKPPPSPEWINKSLDECILTGDPECTFIEGQIDGMGDHRRQTMFYCGHDEECLPFNTIEPMQRAKEAVEEDYAVVGVLEDLPITFAVLQNYIPRYFRGVADIYDKEIIKKDKKVNGNEYKPKISKQTRKLLEKNLTKEIEFYEFCRQRLYKQFVYINSA